MRGFLVGLVAIAVSPYGPAQAQSQEATDIRCPAVRKLLEGPQTRDMGRREIRAERMATIRDLLTIVNEPQLREEHRESVVCAIELLGDLRAAEAAAPLTRLLLFGKKKDLHDSLRLDSAPPPPDVAAPAVRALIQIGIPGLAPVGTRLLSISEKTPDWQSAFLHCLWVIRGILGPKLGKAYLVRISRGRDVWRESRFYEDALRFMNISAKGGNADSGANRTAIPF